MSDAGTQTTKESNAVHFRPIKRAAGEGFAPKLRVLEGEQKAVCTFDGREVINLASNNYLGMATLQGVAEGVGGRGGNGWEWAQERYGPLPGRCRFTWRWRSRSRGLRMLRLAWYFNRDLRPMRGRFRRCWAKRI